MNRASLEYIQGYEAAKRDAVDVINEARGSGESDLRSVRYRVEQLRPSPPAADKGE